MDFGSDESFYDYHWPTTFWTAPKIVRGRGILLGARFLCWPEQLKAKRKESGALAVGQETVVANAYEGEHRLSICGVISGSC